MSAFARLPFRAYFGDIKTEPPERLRDVCETGMVRGTMELALNRAAIAAMAVLGLALFVPGNNATAGPAIGQFEVKDLDAEPGKMEFQCQNAHSWGQPNRKIVREGPGDDDVLYDDNSIVQQRHALEMEGTLTHFLRMRLGIEYERERFEEPGNVGLANAFGELEFDEIAVEVVTIFKPVPKSGGVGFGALAEFEHPIGSDDLNTIVFGPIVEAKNGPWGAIGNLTFIHYFGNGERGGPEPDRDQKWDLGYAAQLSYKVSENWTYTLEAYGTFDRLGDSGTPGEERLAFGDQDQHRAGPVAYYSFSPRQCSALAEVGETDADDGAEGNEADEIEVTLGVGMLFGLNQNTPDETLKWSVEVEF